MFIVLGISAGLGLLFLIFRDPDLDPDRLRKKYANEDSAFLKVSGTNIHFRMEGSGPDLILIHGTASSLHTWDGWVKELRPNFRITRMDLPGFGLTGPNPQGDYSPSFYADLISAMTDSLGIDSAYVAGNSLGGTVAWHLALSDPLLVRKLILIDSGGYPDPQSQDPFIFKLARNPLAAPMLKQITPRFMIRSNIEDVYYRDSLITEQLIDRYYELTLYPGNRQAFIDKTRQKIADQSHRLASITQPVLIQWGKYDEWISPDDALKFRNDIPNSRLIRYDAGHVPMEELPVRTAADALSFLTGR